MPADICLFLEGTYPYVSGGVSNWAHELIQMQPHLKFALVALVPAEAKPTLKYALPNNVASLDTIHLQALPEGISSLPTLQAQALFEKLEPPLFNLQADPKLHDLKTIIQTLNHYHGGVGSEILLNSEEAWDMLLRMYRDSVPESAFIDYFWSWRALLGGFYSVLLADLPEAKVYHAFCTGYAGLFLARAHLETGKPCLVTEHGIYTNERRIEIASADWLQNQKAFSLSVNKTSGRKELKDFWTDTFLGYSKLCYEASAHIITLYEGNQVFQRMDGADPAKMHIIANGIDYDHYASISRASDHPPTIALIGRVVPIKDVKTFIRAAGMLKAFVPDLRALVLGPPDEDEEYYQECLDIVAHLNLEETIVFTGKVKIEDYLGVIDIIVLTSISEAQPLVILEASAAGIPSVATDVGACREMILGSAREKPLLGAGGAICPLANPKAIAEALLALLKNREKYHQCSLAARERVRRYYNKKDQYAAYTMLYGSLMEQQRKAA